MKSKDAPKANSSHNELNNNAAIKLSCITNTIITKIKILSVKKYSHIFLENGLIEGF
jgi:hypothetical protein